jgi:hypothetical protein
VAEGIPSSPQNTLSQAHQNNSDNDSICLSDFEEFSFNESISPLRVASDDVEIDMEGDLSSNQENAGVQENSVGQSQSPGIDGSILTLPSQETSSS